MKRPTRKKAQGWLAQGASLVLLCVLAIPAHAQTDLSYPDLGIPSRVATAYFGPNAFPVPPLIDAEPQADWSLALAADAYRGYAADLTLNPFGRLNIPLFSPRATLSLWMPFFEWYRSTDTRLDECRVDPSRRDRALQGTTPGDVYVATTVQLLPETTRRPALAVRAAVKTASGYDYDLARTYDAPGYFFDLGVGKTFVLGTATSLRVALNTGFLCWQTDRGRQDDAAQYGLLLRLQHRALTLESTLAGYCGWEKGDKPLILSMQGAVRLGAWSPFLLLSAGLHDYPFAQLRLGTTYHFNL